MRDEQYRVVPEDRGAPGHHVRQTTTPSRTGFIRGGSTTSPSPRRLPVTRTDTANLSPEQLAETKAEVAAKRARLFSITTKLAQKTPDLVLDQHHAGQGPQYETRPRPQTPAAHRQEGHNADDERPPPLSSVKQSSHTAAKLRQWRVSQGPAAGNAHAGPQSPPDIQHEGGAQPQLPAVQSPRDMQDEGGAQPQPPAVQQNPDDDELPPPLLSPAAKWSSRADDQDFRVDAAEKPTTTTLLSTEQAATDVGELRLSILEPQEEPQEGDVEAATAAARCSTEP